MNCNKYFVCSESNERLQAHLKERMHSLEEKNHLSNELERTKKRLEDAGQAKARAEQKLAKLLNDRNGHNIG
jgi:predicted nuclease with TOPRIM domain